MGELHLAAKVNGCEVKHDYKILQIIIYDGFLMTEQTERKMVLG